jgi:serine/threonine-protein kinase
VLGGRYTIVEQIGAGGMGQVFKALDRRLGTPVALKLVRADIAMRPELRERFRRELELARQVTHPNVCRVHDLIELDGLTVISMAFVEGQTLDDLIHSVGRLSTRQVLALGVQTCDALSAIHERDIVHRDLKPQNIMVDRSGRPVVMDFGVAHQRGLPRLTDAERVMGTLAWLAPEQAQGEPATARSDIYSLGLAFFEMLTGVPAPGDHKPLPMALRGAGEPARPPSELAEDVPPAMDAVVLRCLERDPERRYPDMASLRESLVEVSAALATGTAPRLVEPEPEQQRRRVRPLWFVAAAVAAAAVALIGGRGGNPTPPPGERLRVALLPLDYVGPPASLFLAQALPIVMGNRIGASPEATVAPFAASRDYSASETADSLATHLGVDVVVSGQLRIEAEQSRVSLAARDANGEILWSRDTEAPVSDALGSAEKLAAELLGHLGAGLGGAGAPRHDPRAMALYVEGRRYLEGWEVDRSYARALGAFEQALEIDPGLGEARASLAMALWRSYGETHEAGFVDRALAEAGAAVRQHPELPEAQLALGIVQLGRGRSVEALGCFDRARTLAPADDQIPLQIAAAYASLGRHEDAAQMYDAAIALRPNHWANYNAAGAQFLRRGDLERARAMFERVVELRPESDVGYNNLATVQLMAGEPLAAEPLLRAALRINPDAAGHANLGFVFYSTGRFEEAAGEFQKAVAANPGDPVYWSNLGDAYRQLGRDEHAGEAYQRGLDLTRGQLEINPDDAEARLGMAMLLAGHGDCQAVPAQIRRGVERAPERSDLRYYGAVAAAVCGIEGLAISELEAAVRAGVVADAASNPDLIALLGHQRLARLLAPADPR